MNKKIIYNTKEECKKNNIKPYPIIYTLQNAIKKLINTKTDKPKLQKQKQNSFEYIYKNHEGGAIYIEIKNNKVYPTILVNNNFINNWFKYVKLDNPLEYIKNKEKILHKKILYPGAQLKKNIKNWTKNGALVQMIEYGTYFDSYQNELIDLIFETANNYKLNNNCFIIWCKDIPLMSVSGYDLYIPKYKWNHKNNEYLKIFSQSTINRPLFYDIPIINNEEWLMYRKKYIAKSCDFNDLNNIIYYDWNDKIEKGFFRGSSTGCYIDSRNHRLNIAKLNIQYPEYLDAGITKYTLRDRIDEDGNISFLNYNKMPLVNKIDMNKFGMYKYVLNIEGNGLPYRKPYLFFLKSVVIDIKSQFISWFDGLLEPYVHYIPYNPIKDDFSDLIDLIKWCKDNDSKCKEIAENGYDFALKHFNYEYATQYISELINTI